MKSIQRLSILLFWPFLCVAQDPGDTFFAAWTVHEIRFQFSQAGFWDSLTQNYTLDQYMKADVSIDGISYPQSGVKYKGNSSYNNPGQKKPFRIDLEEYVNGQAHDGLKKLVLNNGFKDPTFLREKLMLDFLNAHQITAPRCTYARLYVNDQYRGLYSVVEDVNKTFLKDRFGNKDGNLFKGDPKGSMVWKGWDQAMYQSDYELKTNETENNWSDLIRLLNALNNTPTAQLPDSLNKYVHLDSWFDYWAAHNLFVNLDSYVGSGHNYFLYHNTETGQFEWISWDVNEAFGNFQMGLSLSGIKALPLGHIPMPGNQRPMMFKLWNINPFQQELAAHSCALLADFSNDKMDARIDSLANLIRDAVYTDPFKFYTNNQFEQNLSQDLTGTGGPALNGIAGIKPFITARRASLLQQLANYGCTLSDTNSPGPSTAALQIYPNPAVNVVQIRLDQDLIHQVDVYDLQGRLVQQWSGEAANTISLDLSPALPAGVYLLNTHGSASTYPGYLVVLPQ